MSEESRVCSSCEMPYQWRKSTSRYLKMQFCSYTCERDENGGTIEDFLALERIDLPYSTLKDRYRDEIGVLLLA